jgi:SAM-dependent methyltransferase
VGLERELCETPKYKFVIQQTKALGPGLRILEIGCARGFLTSWFILAGYAITGVDVSLEAIASARAAFGDHFALAGSSLVEERAPYDAIYHVGTIGCVADPLGMTRRLLSLLKPGGRLLFNAPNRAALWYRDELWFDSAPPPDVVTLFPPGFWRKQFGDLADVREETELHDADRNLLIGLRQLFGRGWRKPVPLPMSESYKAFRPTPQAGDGLWSLFARCVGKAGRVTKLSRLAPAQQTEYGFFVSMRRNA